MKRGIKNNILAIRDAQSGEEILRKSLQIEKKLLALEEFAKAKTVMFYISKGSEVHTRVMIKEAMGRGKRVVVPVTKLDERRLVASELLGFDELTLGAFGVPEPKNPKLVSVGEIDLIVVPGVAFDPSGNRLGYGLGFYDRFLSSVRDDAIIVALAYESQVLDEIPNEHHDVPADIIITESRVIRPLHRG
ncbi:MAG: 5-formyltetrahydrofolate cyclo-ligase [Methanocellales archaeon]|nr:5-formyltetrahydrofolate cyclo-ligase [Methanocellales archaeon]